MHIDYQQLLDECLIEFIKKVLTKIQNEGIGEVHHLYISFNTNHSKVILSPKIKQLYPNEITIILRYQFEDLRIFDDRFSVRISFNKIPETIEVPFGAISSLVDPSVKFSLQFNNSIANHENVLNEVSFTEIATLKAAAKKSKTAKKSKDVAIIDNHNLQESADVIKIDKFRKKPK